MKKIVCLILSLSIICSSMSFQCFADEQTEVKNMQCCESTCSISNIIKDVNLKFKKCIDIDNLTAKQKKNDPLITSEFLTECKLVKEIAKKVNLPVYEEYDEKRRLEIADKMLKGCFLVTGAAILSLIIPEIKDSVKTYMNKKEINRWNFFEL